jgi:hypothetical protein
MSIRPELTPETIFQIAWEVRDGEADPDDARRLIALFCDCFDRNERPPRELMRFIRDGFRTHLDEGRTLESSLGIHRKPGKPKAAENTRQSIALEVLRLRMEGLRHQDAIEATAKRQGWGETIISKAWKDHKMTALLLLRMERPHDQYPWTPAEVGRLCEIFKKSEWFVASGNTANIVK